MGKQQFSFKGMTRDLDIAKSSNQYAYEVRNMRLTAQEESTLLAYTTEKGNVQYTLSCPQGTSFEGTIVGYCVLNQYLVLFTHASGGDHIYRLTEASANTMSVTELYAGTSLDFNNNTKIDAIGVYENEDVQKVYWIDGEHQPRMINIKKTYTPEQGFCPFDFVLEMTLNETVTIKKLVNTYGVFTAGTIQYVLCYYMDNGQKSNAFYVSPINYITKENKGGQPGETLNNAFRIIIQNPDTNWDNVLIYSVSRSSENATPVCRKVVSLSTSSATDNTLEYTDSGLNTESVDYSEILYLGGGNVIPYTMEQKNNTLFFGNITDNSFYIPTNSELAEALKDCGITFDVEPYDYTGTDPIYPYEFQIKEDDQSEISTFIIGELYKFGVIFQNNYGQWSNVLTIGDDVVGSENGYFRCDVNPSDASSVKRIIAQIDLSSALSYINAIGNIKKVKIVRLKKDNEVVAQGVICPTVFNNQRLSGNIYSQSSWFFRSANNAYPLQYEPYSKHNSNIRTSVFPNGLNEYKMRGEIVSAEELETSVYIPNTTKGQMNDSDFFVDWNVLTIHSPEITYGKFSTGDYIPKIVGYVTMDTSKISADIKLSTVPANNVNIDPVTPSNCWKDTVMMCQTNYHDWPYMLHISQSVSDCIHEYEHWQTPAAFPVYAWHRNGSLGTEPGKTGDNLTWHGELKTKCTASLRVSKKTRYFDTSVDLKNPLYDSHYIKSYNEGGGAILLENDPNNNDFSTEKIYLGELGDDYGLLSPKGYRLYNSNIKVDGDEKYTTVGVASIWMKYKSTPHGILDLKYYSNNNQCIPYVDYDMANNYSHVFWNTHTPAVSDPKIRAIIDIGGDNYAKNIIKYKVIIPSGQHFVSSWDFLLRKGLVNLYGKINIGDYVCIYNTSSFNAEEHVADSNGLEGIVLRREQCPDNFNIYPDISAVKDSYYYFRTVVKQGNTMYYTDDTNYFFNNGVLQDVNIIYNSPNYYAEDAVQLTSGQFVIPSVQEEDVAQFWKIPQILLTENNLPVYQVIGESGLDIDSADGKTPYTYLVNITREVEPLSNFINTQWVISGNSVSVTQLSSPVEAKIADGYYQRFDCLKTYPYSPEDPNQVVEIFSFMVQTRINLDGRWDINRSLMDNTIVDNTNFGLLNQGYTQEDNLFSSSYLDSEKFKSSYHPNQIIWTGTKEYGSDIDNWTHVIPTSTLDADGVYGKVTALKLWNNNLMFFQDKAFGVVQYNERNAIASTTGVPIELANSGKVDGKYYISNNIGCSNKESIQITQRGLYFTDDNTREIYRYGSEGPECLSKSKGFNTYFYNPKVKFGKIKTFYDPKLKDVYFKVTTENVATTSGTRDVTPPTPVMFETSECLLFNEQYDEFMSFMDYDMDYMFPLGDDLISIKDSTLWEQFAGNYLSFFGVNKDYSLTFVSAENPTTDKTFTNVEFRADVLGNNDKLVVDANNRAVLPFTKIRAWNEYQDSTDKQFVTSLGYSWNTSQKFRIWRADIPRVGYMERIRNPWAKIKLSYHSDSLPNVKTTIHDISVGYI